MKRIVLSLILIAAVSLSMSAQKNIELKFDKNGDFKILQFTDTHIDYAKNKNMDMFDMIVKIMDIEKPDVVILTGDIITGGGEHWDGYKRLGKIFKKAKMPWAVVYGNHDSENNTARDKIEAFVEKQPYCLNHDDKSTFGSSDFVLPVYGKNKKVEALLYCMDSNDYSTLKPLVDGYGWFKFDQIAWYRKKSEEYTKANGGKPLPALMFFHIPLPEYTKAWENKKHPPVGVRNEDECSPDVNSGMFVSLLEKGDVMGTFVGHDHINDYIGIYYNVALAYGRVSKVMPDPEEDPLAGARVIVLKEGLRKFVTWIRDMDGKKELEVTYPDTFTLEGQEK